jgi:hypothetical protein
MKQAIAFAPPETNFRIESQNFKKDPFSLGRWVSGFSELFEII